MKRIALTFLVCFGIYAADQPYDIEPYRHLPIEARDRIIQEHNADPFCPYYEEDDTPGPRTDGGDYVLMSNSTPRIDEKWEAICNVRYASYSNDTSEAIFIDGSYKTERYKFWSREYEMTHGLGNYPNPQAALLFYWKRAAWMHPDDAEVFAHALTYGLGDKLAARPEWAEYWIQRARLLRETSAQWYLPTDAAEEEQRKKRLTDIDKLYVEFKIKRDGHA